ncbi:uncharacterized protein NMK_3366 [Novimethylophilus kurashikiensis]|uniref:Uncharacterized protein n=1 Tax=Novimethylophilus kurashikiensis TaxID=1825523 RepID=A0A2R5FCL8_9PROT|nr:hypothetical protein [Novimethylophilus kurashikiensis]GBG15755.1 uncharacterized protein NMK_3366 [Novimethylophilus kurashikiensis]
MEYAEFVRISSEHDTTSLLNKKRLAETYGAEASFVEDNIRLDFFGQQLAQEYDYVSAELMRRVFLAAKIVFSRHPGAAFLYDAANVYDMISTPYAVECKTPEQWLRMYVKTFQDKQWNRQPEPGWAMTVSGSAF